jgi:hypothetical protein
MYEGIVTERAQRDEREKKKKKKKKKAKRVARRIDDQHINYIGKHIPDIIN